MAERRGPAQRGFTLVEMMVALVISGVLMALVFKSAFTMTDAFRAQIRSTAVMQTLQAVRETVLTDLRQAGYLLPSGLRTQAGGDPNQDRASVSVINNADGSGPDSVRVMFADGASVKPILGVSNSSNDYADVADATGIAVGDLVVLTNPQFHPNGSLQRVRACLVKVTSIFPTGGVDRIQFVSSGGAPFNSTGNGHCAPTITSISAELPDTDATLFRLVARSYRIDPERKDQSVLQMSPSGFLAGSDWQDLALGVTNLQIATRFYEAGDGVDRDGDGDPERDWYSGEAQEEADPTGDRPSGAVPVSLSVSIETRTARPITTATGASSATLLGSPADFNAIGDWAAVDLNLPDASRPEAYRGQHAYRWTTTQIDLRNLGIGQ